MYGDDEPDMLQEELTTYSQSRALKHLIAQVHDLAVLPHVVFKVLELSSSTDNPTADIESAITIDPGFSSKVLILANSASTALPRKVLSIKEAVMFLGYKAVRQLAMTVGIYDMFVGKNDRDSLRRRAWWRHSVDTAVCAKYLAEHTGKMPGDDAYTCGLLHYIGKSLLERFGEADYKHVEEMVLFGIKDYKAEEAIYGCNHVEVSVAAARKWGLAEELISGLDYTTPPLDDDPLRCHRACTALATQIATLAVEGNVFTEDTLHCLPAWAMETMGLQSDQAGKIVSGGMAAITNMKVQL